MRWPWLAVLASGCYQPSEVCTGVACMPGEDAPIDLPADVAPAICAGVPEGLMPDTCFQSVPRAMTVFGTGVLNTDAGSGDCDVPDGGGSDVCIVAAESISIEGLATWRGKRPLVLWSATTITVAAGATLDVGTHQPGAAVLVGAGANDASCPLVDGAGDTTVTPTLGAGGCGGSFSGLGGVGGIARNSAKLLATVCTPVVQQLTRVRGGCRGGHGGNSNTVGSLNGGSSGGAVYLMAKGEIRVDGTIDARGAHGGVANSNAGRQPGGGGGGSGGMIGFDTPTGLVLNDTAILAAQGGGGSSGAGLDTAANPDVVFQGLSGKDSPLNPIAFAQKSGNTVSDNTGGAADFNGDEGGDVAVGATGGGGGGAGGVGYIRVYPKLPMSTNAAKILPPLTAP